MKGHERFCVLNAGGKATREVRCPGSQRANLSRCNKVGGEQTGADRFQMLHALGGFDEGEIVLLGNRMAQTFGHLVYEVDRHGD
jgi:hypothetical protein